MTVPPATKFHCIDLPFPMRRGGTLDGVQIAYETWGELAPDHSNAVLLFTGLSPSAHAASSTADRSPGWWEEMLGAGKPIDTDRYFVICVNSLGSCFGSSGPASLIPGTNEPYRLSFPVLSIEDIAQGGHEVVRALEIEKLFATVGSSMGGMTALVFNLLYPGASRGLISISAAARATPFAIAMRSLQREIIRSDAAWADGTYDIGTGPILGMRLARKLGMITYRSAVEWQDRFGRVRITDDRFTDEPFAMRFEIESYLDAHARKFTGQFDPNCVLYLSRSMDLFDIADHGSDVADALCKVSGDRMLIVGVHSDILFPVEQQRELAEGLKRPGRALEFIELPSVQGHDSFLVDHERFGPILAKFFS